MSNYVYRCTEPGTWEVGYFDTWGNWIMESDHDTKEYAREHAYYLNGGNCNQDCNCNQEIIELLITELKLAEEILYDNHSYYARKIQRVIDEIYKKQGAKGEK